MNMPDYNGEDNEMKSTKVIQKKVKAKTVFDTTDSEKSDPLSVVQKRKSRRFIRYYLPALLVGLVVLLGATSAYFYKKSKSNPNEASQTEVKSLVQKVNRLVVLPMDETPMIATVSDPAALKDQSFFIDAKKGDKVLIYSNAKKAILYDPTLDKVVTIAPLNISAGTTPAMTTGTPSSTSAIVPPSTTKKK
jgi:hypothetical protein